MTPYEKAIFDAVDAMLSLAIIKSFTIGELEMHEELKRIKHQLLQTVEILDIQESFLE